MEVIRIKKKNFAMLVLGTIGGLLFSVGLCMCLLPEWNAFDTGVLCAGVGFLLLLTLLLVARKENARAEKKTNWKLIGRIAYGILSSLVLGVGMCMIMVFDMLLWGIAAGVAGIVMLLCLIPMCIGLQ